MSKEDAVEKLLKRLPKEGLLKVSSTQTKLSREKRFALIRRGNELYNEGNLDVAKRIFVATGYTDGLIRLGDYYYERKEVLEAFRMYILAPNPQKVDFLLEKSAGVIRKWMNDEGDAGDV